MKRVYLALALLLMPMMISACSSGEFAVNEVWARPGIAGGNSAVYFVIENNTSTPDTLLAADSAVANSVEVHSTVMREDGTMSMQQQASVPVPANENVEFKPGGLHIMLIDLPEPLEAGDSFELTLNFQNAGPVILQVEVKQP